MIRAVVFDVGETLVNESRLWRLWAEWFNVPEHVFLAVLGSTIERGEHHRKVFEFFEPHFRMEAAREERRRTGIPDSFDASDLYADVSPCVAALLERGLTIGVAGNQPEGFESLLTKLGLPIEFVGSSAKWNVRKPAPAFFHKVIAELGLPAEEIVYVGDRLDNDILPAQDAGMIGVFVRRGPWGFLHARRPEISKAHVRLHSLSGLPEALDRFSLSSTR